MFNTKLSLESHIRNQDGSKCHKCDICDKMFTNNHSKRTHYQKQHNTLCITESLKSNRKDKKIQADLGKENIFLCNICQCKSSSQTSLNIHIRSVHGRNRKFECDICLKKFAKSSALKLHIVLKHKTIFDE